MTRMLSGKAYDPAPDILCANFLLDSIGVIRLETEDPRPIWNMVQWNLEHKAPVWARRRLTPKS